MSLHHYQDQATDPGMIDWLLVTGYWLLVTGYTRGVPQCHCGTQDGFINKGNSLCYRWLSLLSGTDCAMASYPELSQFTMTENDLNVAIIGEKWTYDDGTVWSVSDVLDSWPPVVVFKSSDPRAVVIDRTAFVTDLGWTKVLPKVKPAPRSTELDHAMT